MTLRETFQTAIQIFSAYKILTLLMNMLTIGRITYKSDELYAKLSIIEFLLYVILFIFAFIYNGNYLRTIVPADINITDFLEKFNKSYTVKTVLFIVGILLILLEFLAISQDAYSTMIHAYKEVLPKSSDSNHYYLYFIQAVIAAGTGITFIVMSKKINLNYLDNANTNYSKGNIFYTVLFSIFLVYTFKNSMFLIEKLVSHYTFKEVIWSFLPLGFTCAVTLLIKAISEKLFKEKITLVRPLHLLATVIYAALSASRIVDPVYILYITHNILLNVLFAISVPVFVITVFRTNKNKVVKT